MTFASVLQFVGKEHCGIDVSINASDDDAIQGKIVNVQLSVAGLKINKTQ